MILEMGSSLWGRYWKVVANGSMTWRDVMGGRPERPDMRINSTRAEVTALDEYSVLEAAHLGLKNG